MKQVIILCSFMLFTGIVLVKFIETNKTKGDYQILISGEDSLTIKDGKREVGKIFYTDDSEIGYLLQEDQKLISGEPNFERGDIIAPDYACSDTLVVINANELNAGLKAIDGTDTEIYSVLHTHCNIYHSLKKTKS